MVSQEITENKFHHHIEKKIVEQQDSDNSVKIYNYRNLSDFVSNIVSKFIYCKYYMLQVTHHKFD